VPPARIDLLKSADGVDFDRAYEQRAHMTSSGLTIAVVGIDDLMAMKRAADRDQDRVDVKVAEAPRASVLVSLAVASGFAKTLAKSRARACPMQSIQLSQSSRMSGSLRLLRASAVYPARWCARFARSSSQCRMPVGSRAACHRGRRRGDTRHTG